MLFAIDLLSILLVIGSFFGFAITGNVFRIKSPGTKSNLIGVVLVGLFLVIMLLDILGIIPGGLLANAGWTGLIVNTVLLFVIIFGVSSVIKRIQRRKKTSVTVPKTKAISTADVTAAGKSEATQIAKLRKMLAVSARIRQDQMRDTLGLDAAQFNEKIFDWAAEFGFQVDGDYVNIGQGNVDGFIAELDKQFAEWKQITDGKTN